jgi:integrase
MSEKFFVTPYPQRPRSPWKLEIPQSVAGKRIRRFFPLESDAFMEGARLTRQIREKGTASLEEPVGLSLTKAVSLFNGQFLDYSKSHREKVEKVTRWLAEDLGGSVRSVTPLQCLEWFRGIDGVSTSRATVFRYARLFWNWCVKTDLIDRSPWRPVTCPDSTPRRNILTTEEMKILLADEQMSDHLRASILLGGFAGLRTVEVLRLRWEDVEKGQIYIGPETAKQKKKGNRERLVDMTEPLKRRAKFFAGKRGVIVPMKAEDFYEERRELVKRLRKAGQVQWKVFPENSLRHSFATYHLGKSNNPGTTAYQMGTSIQLVISTYAVPARRSNWRAWWRI